MIGPLFFIIIGAEVINYIYYLYLKKYVHEKRYYKTKLNYNKMEQYIKSLSKEELINWIKNSISYNFSDKNYYTNVPLDDIPQNKIIKWVSYQLYFKSMWQLNKEELNISKNMLKYLENKIDHKFKDVINDNIYFLKFGNNRVESIYRFLFVYISLNILKNIIYFVLACYGFKKYKTPNGNITYFYYECKKNTKTTMFLHGLGLGITPYLSYIIHLSRATNVIIPILPNISNMEFTSYFSTLSNNNLFPSYKNWRLDTKYIINHHNLKSIDIVAHSFGTIILGILLKDILLNKIIKKRIFIEPVCFIDQSYKIYRYINEPTTYKNDVISKIFNYLIYDDIYFRYVSQRFLYGPEFWLDYEDVKNNNNLIIVSQEDNIIPSNRLYNKMKNKNIHCLIVHDASHSEIFIAIKFKSILSYVNSFLFE